MGVAYYMEQVISFKTADLIQTGRREKHPGVINEVPRQVIIQE